MIRQYGLMPAQEILHQGWKDHQCKSRKPRRLRKPKPRPASDVYVFTAGDPADGMIMRDPAQRT
jgi:hypothetical protein